MKTIASFRSKLLALTLALMASVSTFAYDFQSGYLFYNILPDRTVAVTSETYGIPYDYLPTSLVIPSEVSDYYGAKYQVSEIANGAFQGCDELESVIIPNTVKKIGMYAFTGCTKLIDISFPESLEDVMGSALYDCAWYDNQPDGLIYVGNLLYRYKGTAPAGAITIKEGTTAVLDLAFFKQPNITSVVLPESVTSVQVQAFGDCPNLESVTLPTWLSVIEDYTFQNCSKLQNINLPLGLEKIGKEAFAGCSSLTNLEWPLQLKSIGVQAFYNCNNLDGIENISPNIEKIGADAFCNTAWESKQPSGYLYIHNIFYAYTGEVTDSMHIEIKKGTTYISGGAVYRCAAKINEYSTENVVSKITIPNSVTEIEDGTFRHCRNLDTIICTSVEPPVISKNTFNLTLQKNKHVLLLPTEALDIYKWVGLLPYQAAPYWNNFTNVKPITDPHVYDPMYFEKDSIQYHILNDTIAPFEVEVTYTFGSLSNMTQKNYPELTEVNIPAFVEYKGHTYIVTRIGELAFNCAQKLQRVTMGENIKTIDRFAIMNCPQLKEVQIGENVDSILLDAFGFGKLQQLSIPKNVKYIAPLIVRKNPITSINVHPENSNYTSIDGVLFNKNENILHTFPAAYATRYTIPESVDTIGSCAFAGTSIESVIFPKNLVCIANEAFTGTNLTELILPASLQSIGMYAFDMCSNLKEVICRATTPPIMSDGESEYKYHVFMRVPISDIPLYVPAESVEAYKSANQWKEFGQIQPLPQTPEDLFPTLWGLQRTTFYHYTECSDSYSSLTASNEIVTINDKPYLRFGKMFLREENNQVLIYSAAYDKDLVLYDWNLEVGDSISLLAMDYGVYPEYAVSVVDYRVIVDIDENGDLIMDTIPTDKVVVDKISTITLLDGKEYKTWHLATGWAGGITYVEGIGILSEGYGGGDYLGLIRPEELPTCYYGDLLVCVSKNNKLLYQMDPVKMDELGAECLCDYNSGPKKDNAKNGKIGGRPTPTQWNMLEVETKEMDGTPTILRAETFSYTLENDSIVTKGKTFYQLARQSTKDTAITKSFVGALHFGEDEDNRVYFLRDGVEYVLYDFTAEPGDTVEIFAGINNYPQETTYTHVVTGKDTLQNGACRMMLEVVFPDETSSVENAQKVWLAGLGSIDGIVHNVATRATKARSSETQTSVMLCAWRDDDCLYTTDHPEYDTFGCIYNQDPTAVESPTSPSSYQKILHEGRLLILHNGKIYNVLGVSVK